MIKVLKNKSILKMLLVSLYEHVLPHSHEMKSALEFMY